MNKLTVERPTIKPLDTGVKLMNDEKPFSPHQWKFSQHAPINVHSTAGESFCCDGDKLTHQEPLFLYPFELTNMKYKDTEINKWETHCEHFFHDPEPPLVDAEKVEFVHQRREDDVESIYSEY